MIALLLVAGNASTTGRQRGQPESQARSMIAAWVMDQTTDGRETEFLVISPTPPI